MDILLNEMLMLALLIIACISLGLEGLIVVIVAVPILFVVLKSVKYMGSMIRW